MAQALKIVEAPSAQEVEFATEREALIITAKQFGADAARGSASILNMALYYADAASRGFATQADAETVYGAFREGYRTTDAAFVESLPAAEKVSHSKMSTFALPGSCDLALVMAERARAIRATLETKARAQSSLYDAMVRVNREVATLYVALTVKDNHAATIAAVTMAVTDEKLAAWLTKSEAGKSDIEKLSALVDAVQKLATKETSSLAGSCLVDTIGALVQFAEFAKAHKRAPKPSELPALAK